MPLFQCKELKESEDPFLHLPCVHAWYFSSASADCRKAVGTNHKRHSNSALFNLLLWHKACTCGHNFLPMTRLPPINNHSRSSGARSVKQTQGGVKQGEEGAGKDRSGARNRAGPDPAVWINMNLLQLFS